MKPSTRTPLSELNPDDFNLSVVIPADNQEVVKANGTKVVEYGLLGGNIEYLPEIGPSSDHTDSSDDSDASVSVLSQNSPGFSELSKSSPYPLPSPLTSKIRVNKGLSTSLDSAEALRAFKTSSRPKDTFSPSFLKNCVSAFDDADVDIPASLPLPETPQATDMQPSAVSKESSTAKQPIETLINQQRGPSRPSPATFYFRLASLLVVTSALIVIVVDQYASRAVPPQASIEHDINHDSGAMSIEIEHASYLFHDESMYSTQQSNDGGESDGDLAEKSHIDANQVFYGTDARGQHEFSSEVVRAETRFSLRNVVVGIRDFPRKIISLAFRLLLALISRIFMQSALFEE